MPKRSAGSRTSAAATGRGAATALPGEARHGGIPRQVGPEAIERVLRRLRPA